MPRKTQISILEILLSIGIIIVIIVLAIILYEIAVNNQNINHLIQRIPSRKCSE